jgi:mRNA interferase RelE/StbE
MAYEVIFLPSAERALKRLPTDTHDRILAKITALKDSPRPAGAKKMVGYTNVYRIRERTSRIVYIIEDRYLIVMIVDIAHRKDIYKQLGKLPTPQELLAIIKARREQKK